MSVIALTGDGEEPTVYPHSHPDCPSPRQPAGLRLAAGHQDFTGWSIRTHAHTCMCSDACFCLICLVVQRMSWIEKLRTLWLVFGLVFLVIRMYFPKYGSYQNCFTLEWPSHGKTCSYVSRLKWKYPKLHFHPSLVWWDQVFPILCYAFCLCCIRTYHYIITYCCYGYYCYHDWSVCVCVRVYACSWW